MQGEANNAVELSSVQAVSGWVPLEACKFLGIMVFSKRLRNKVGRGCRNIKLCLKNQCRRRWWGGVDSIRALEGS
jgi:hypothetical protein